MVSVVLFICKEVSAISKKEKLEKKKYARAVKCPHCEKQLDRNTEPFVEHSKRYFHEKCFEYRDIRAKARAELIEYICYIHKIDKPSGFIVRQIKNFEDINGYTTRGMLTTLRYVHEIQGLPVKGHGIGIIESFYEQAVRHYTNLFKVRDENAKINYDNKEKIIYTSPPKKREKKIIDIGGL